jgi:hypothetical protein
MSFLYPLHGCLARQGSIAGDTHTALVTREWVTGGPRRCQTLAPPFFASFVIRKAAFRSITPVWHSPRT